MKKNGIIILLLCFLYPLSSLLAQSNNYQLSTHILDINQGKPAQGVSIILFKLNEETTCYEQLDSYQTDENGRVKTFLSTTTNNRGTYKLRFETSPYFEAQNIKSIYPYIEVVFDIKDEEHYHIPITVSANGYSTYRGS